MKLFRCTNNLYGRGRTTEGGEEVGGERRKMQAPPKMERRVVPWLRALLGRSYRRRAGSGDARLAGATEAGASRSCCPPAAAGHLLAWLLRCEGELSDVDQFFRFYDPIC